MKNKNKLILSALVMTFMGVSAMSYSDATTVIPYKDVNGVQSINIQDLVKSQGGSIIEDNHELYGKGYTYTINDKVVTVYENGPFIYVDGRLTPLKTEELVDSDTGEKFNFPVAQTPTKDGDGFLIPMTVIEKYTGIKGSDKGIEVEVKEEVKEEQKEEVNKEENSSSSNESSSNNNTSSNGGATNKPSNGNSGTTNGGSSNNGSNNSGSTNMVVQQHHNQKHQVHHNNQKHQVHLKSQKFQVHLNNQKRHKNQKHHKIIVFHLIH